MTAKAFGRAAAAAALAAASALAAVAAGTGQDRPAVDCRAALEAYVRDPGLGARREGDAVVFTRAGIRYSCRCYRDDFPPVCRPGGEFVGAGGLGGIDLSRLEPGQQAALLAVKTLIYGLFSSVHDLPAAEGAPAGEAALAARQDMLWFQEGLRQKVLDAWDLFRKEEEKRLAGPSAAPEIDGLVGRYGRIVADLAGLSGKLAEVRRQRLDAELDLGEAGAALARLEAADATGEALAEARAAKGEAAERARIAGRGEKAYLEDVERIEGRVKDLDKELRAGAAGRGQGSKG